MEQVASGQRKPSCDVHVRKKPLVQLLCQAQHRHAKLFSCGGEDSSTICERESTERASWRQRRCSASVRLKLLSRRVRPLTFSAGSTMSRSTGSAFSTPAQHHDSERSCEAAALLSNQPAPRQNADATWNPERNTCYAVVVPSHTRCSSASTAPTQATRAHPLGRGVSPVVWRLRRGGSLSTSFPERDSPK